MNGKQLFERAMLLLGYVDTNGDVLVDTGLQKRAVAIINQIAADLHHDDSTAPEPIVRLDQTVAVDKHAAEAMPYGVAMLLAQTHGDADGQAVFATIYNRKRAKSGGFAQVRQDVLPR